jgi:hypothetical protein
MENVHILVASWVRTIEEGRAVSKSTFYVLPLCGEYICIKTFDIE